MLATHWPAVTSLLYLYPRELMQELHPLRMVGQPWKSLARMSSEKSFLHIKRCYSLSAWLAARRACTVYSTTSAPADDAIERSVRVGS